MLKIGQVVFKEDLVNHERVNYVEYIQGDVSFKDLLNGCPTLYVGWKFLKEINQGYSVIDQHSILEKKIISNQLYWEYAFSEKKDDHVTGINEFLYNVPDYYFKTRYKYINVDPVFFSIQNTDDLVQYLPKQSEHVYQYKDEMVYILFEKTIFGVDLKMYSYFGFSQEEILNKIFSKTLISTKDIDGSIYQKYYKILPFYDNLKRYLVSILEM